MTREEKQERLTALMGNLRMAGMSIEASVQETYNVALTLAKVDGLSEDYRLQLAEEAVKMTREVSERLGISLEQQMQAWKEQEKEWRRGSLSRV